MNAAAPAKKPTRAGPASPIATDRTSCVKTTETRRDVAFADDQGALFLKGHDREKQGEAGAGDQAQPCRRERYRPVACRRLDRRDLEQRPRPVLGFRALEQPLVRRAAIPRRRVRGMTQKARRPAVLVFAEHGRTDDDDPTFDGFANLTSTLRG